jgi:cytochrome c peroxidase
MPGFFPRRSTLLATALAVAGFGAFGFAGIGLGAVIVGETRRIDLGPKAVPGMDAMKAQYRRPATIPFPKENPYTPEKASLGKKLYFDTRLSLTSAQSCASCHSPGFGWGDGLAVGVGHGMAKLGRHSPTIVNAAWGAIFMWDGRLATLEEQALGPIQAAGEMNMPLEQLIGRLTSIGEYKPLFAAAFPGEEMSAKTLAKAIATYERTVVSERAPFDSWIEGNEKAISRRYVPRVTRAGTSPMTASRISGCRARMSVAVNSWREWSRCSTPSRRPACAKLLAEAPICMMDRSPRWKRWLNTTIAAASIVRAVPT